MNMIELRSPNYTPGRTDGVKKITIHHAASCASAVDVAGTFRKQARQASANYVVDDDNIVLCVDEWNRAWTSGSFWNDDQAITLELCNDGMEPDWHVSDATINNAICLIADICKRYNIELWYDGTSDGSLTLHKMFQPTLCPGPYLESRIPFIVEMVNKLMKEKKTMTREEKEIYLQACSIEYDHVKMSETDVNYYATLFDEDADFNDDLSYIDENVKKGSFIKRAYRVLLGREADPEGFNNYMTYDRYRDIIHDIMMSEEYNN